jgi:hypothetical protein
LEWLSLAEFTYNNQEHSAMKCSPFFVNYGRRPNKGTNQNLQVKSQSVIELAKQMRQIHEVGAAISHAQRLMKTQYDKLVMIINRETRSGLMEKKSPLTDQRRNLMTEDMGLSWWNRRLGKQPIC